MTTSHNADNIKQVTIVINGRNRVVNCASDEVETLEHAEKALNSMIQDIRRQTPQIDNEELYMLCALNLSSQAEQLKQVLEREQAASRTVQHMLEVLHKVQPQPAADIQTGAPIESQ